MKYVDAHAHIHEDPSLMNEDVLVVGVSDDLRSSKKTLELEGIVKCVGVHPWEVERTTEGELQELERLLENADCIGEVGLDKRYVKDIEKGRRFFEVFVKWSKEYDLPLNIHALDAWREVFDLVMKMDVRSAYFHWYNGPLDLIDEICSQGYFIGINAALKIQRKHIKVLERTPINCIMTETDAPYNYRGLVLRPEMVKELVRKVAKMKGLSERSTIERIYFNFERWSLKRSL